MSSNIKLSSLITYISELFTIELHVGPCLRSLVNHTLFFHQQLLMCQSACFQKRGSLFGGFWSLVFSLPRKCNIWKNSTKGRFYDTKYRDAYLVGVDDPFHFPTVYIDYYRPMAKIRITCDLENPTTAGVHPVQQYHHKKNKPKLHPEFWLRTWTWRKGKNTSYSGSLKSSSFAKHTDKHCLGPML